jgi:osmotically-inducible protein OsmY
MKTDIQLQQDVMTELEWEPSVNSTQIGVEAKDGVVTLAGHVGSYFEKWEAERAAQRVAGVKALAVEMDVALPGSSVRHDVDIARAASNVLQWSTYWPEDRIKVVVEDGWITLSGELDWEYQREAAERAIRGLMGVVGISNQIVLKPLEALTPVKSEIEAALTRRIHSDARNIVVDVNGTNVALSGTVHTWAERDAARNSAWATPGVRNVSDSLNIVY